MLRIYVEEAEETSRTSLLDSLRTGIVQSVAAVELLTRRWCEPPERGALHLSTLVHQTLSLVAQYGGVKAAEAWQALGESGPFREVGVPRFLEVLRSMASSALLEQSPDGTLVLGERGEVIVSHFSFFAVFQTPEEFRVLAGGQLVGSIAYDLAILAGVHILLAGRRWRVLSVLYEEKAILVEASRGGRVPRFAGGGGGLVHDEVRQEMRRIYDSERVPEYLSEEAARLLAQGRASYRRANLGEHRFVSTKDSTSLFLCRGDRIQNTIALLFIERELEVNLAGPLLTILDADPRGAEEALRAILSEGRETP